MPRAWVSAENTESRATARTLRTSRWERKRINSREEGGHGSARGDGGVAAVKLAGKVAGLDGAGHEADRDQRRGRSEDEVAFAAEGAAREDGAVRGLDLGGRRNAREVDQVHDAQVRVRAASRNRKANDVRVRALEAREHVRMKRVVIGRD